MPKAEASATVKQPTMHDARRSFMVDSSGLPHFGPKNRRVLRLLKFLAPTLCVLLAFALAVAASRLVGDAGHSQRAPAGMPLPAAPAQDPAISEIALPSAQLAPDDVVRLQLGGLANRENPSLGILQCYYFASPANLAITGTLDAFAELVRTPPYDVMTTARAWLVGEPQIDGRSARVLVTLIDPAGRLRSFVFLLERQTEPPYTDCWMTDSVLQMGKKYAPPLPPIAPGV